MHARPITTAAVVLFVLLVAVSAGAAEPASVSGRVAVLDAGTFYVIEAHQAPLGEVLTALASRLGATLANTERLDLSRVVDGRRIGSLVEIMRWLVPERSFVLLYEGRRPDDPRPPRVERIGFLDAGAASSGDHAAPPTGRAAASPGAAAPASRGPVAPAAPIVPAPPAEGESRHGAPGGGPGRGEDLRNDGSKPDVPYTPMSEIKSVAEQLRAFTPMAQLQIERDALAPDRVGAPADFLRPQSDAAQTTLQQQAQRSQALAVEQLRALLEAFKAACRGAEGSGPC